MIKNSKLLQQLQSVHANLLEQQKTTQVQLERITKELEAVKSLMGLMNENSIDSPSSKRIMLDFMPAKEENKLETAQDRIVDYVVQAIQERRGLITIDEMVEYVDSKDPDLLGTKHKKKTLGAVLSYDQKRGKGRLARAGRGLYGIKVAV
jgi:hypothetical protein